MRDTVIGRISSQFSCDLQKITSEVVVILKIVDYPATEYED